MVKRKGTQLLLLAGVGVLLVTLSTMWLYWNDIVAWYQFQKRFESLGLNEQGYPEYRHRQSKIVLVHVPSGSFLMGSPDGEKGRKSRESPQHEVELSSFLIAKTEVTQEQWVRVMGSNPSDFQGDTLPVVDISWDDCQEFCKLTGLNLPTEAQWEYACRAGTTTPYHTGDKESDLAKIGWYVNNAKNRTHTVGEKPPNAWGLHDMHGNVFEWCEDLYNSSFYSMKEATKKDPLCITGRGTRVVRDGLYSEPARICRAASRRGSLRSNRDGDTGFRPTFRFSD